MHPAARSALLAALIGVAPCVARAQPDGPARTPGRQTTSEAASDARWPEHVEKELHGKDFRGKPAPEFVVEEVLTKKPDREGKVVLIDFWATWCGPCRALMPELDKLQKQFKDDLVVIGVSDEPAATVRQFLKRTKLGYTQAVDTQGRMKNQLKINGIPHVIIISTDGIVRWQGFPGSPEDPLTADVIRRIIAADPGLKAGGNGERGPARDAGVPASKSLAYELLRLDADAGPHAIMRTSVRERANLLKLVRQAKAELGQDGVVIHIYPEHAPEPPSPYEGETRRPFERYMLGVYVDEPGPRRSGAGESLQLNVAKPRKVTADGLAWTELSAGDPDEYRDIPGELRFIHLIVRAPDAEPETRTRIAEHYEKRFDRPKVLAISLVTSEEKWDDYPYLLPALDRLVEWNYRRHADEPGEWTPGAPKP